MMYHWVYFYISVYEAAALSAVAVSLLMALSTHGGLLRQAAGKRLYLGAKCKNNPHREEAVAALAGSYTHTNENTLII